MPFASWDVRRMASRHAPDAAVILPTIRRRQIGLGHPADRPSAHPEQLANPLLRTVGAG